MDTSVRLISLLFLLTCATVGAAETSVARSARAVPAVTAPVIDGVLEEACWGGDPAFQEFPATTTPTNSIHTRRGDGSVTTRATDEVGMNSVEDIVTIHDLHATMLHLVGLDHERLTYRFGGRDFRLTDVYGRIIRDIIA